LTIEFISSEKLLGKGEGGSNEDDEYFDRWPTFKCRPNLADPRQHGADSYPPCCTVSGWIWLLKHFRRRLVRATYGWP